MPTSIDAIRQLFTVHGSRMYSGEPVTQLEHSLQTAALAEAAGADAALVAACFLHDIGHLINDQGETPTLRGVDDWHQHIAVTFLRDTFPAAVLEPIRLHVDAKRYLCATRPGYQAALSADSRRSLVLQGGTFSAAQAAEFAARPHADQAVQLRLWDDAAKVAGGSTPGLEHYLGLLGGMVEAG